MAEAPVLVERRGAIALLTLNREPRGARRPGGRAALQMARLYATRAPLSLWFAKTAVDVGLTMPLDAALAFEIGLTTQLFTTEDRAEGLRAFHERCDPKFRGS
jgi:enoyl-CoA hydratase